MNWLDGYTTAPRRKRPPPPVLRAPIDPEYGYPEDAVVTLWAPSQPLIGWLTLLAERLDSKRTTRITNCAYQLGFGGVMLAPVVPTFRDEAEAAGAALNPDPELIDGVLGTACNVAMTARRFRVHAVVVATGDLTRGQTALLELWRDEFCRTIRPVHWKCLATTAQGYPQARSVPLQGQGLRPWDMPNDRLVDAAELRRLRRTAASEHIEVPPPPPLTLVHDREADPFEEPPDLVA